MEQIRRIKRWKSLQEIANMLDEKNDRSLDRSDSRPSAPIVDISRTLLLQICTAASFLGLKLPPAELVDHSACYGLEMMDEVVLNWKLPRGSMSLVVEDLPGSDSQDRDLRISLEIANDEGRIIHILLGTDGSVQALYDGLFNWFDRSGDAARRSSSERWRRLQELKESFPDLWDSVAGINTLEIPRPPADTDMGEWRLDQFGDPYLWGPPHRFIGPELTGITLDQLEQTLKDLTPEAWPHVPREHFEWAKTTLHNFNLAARLIGVDLPECRIDIPNAYPMGEEVCILPVRFRWEELLTGSLILEWRSDSAYSDGSIRVTCRGNVQDLDRESSAFLAWDVRRDSAKTLIEMIRATF